MTVFPRILAAALFAGGAAVPAAAQYPYPYPAQPYPQPYPYGYQQQYPYGGTVIDQVIGQLLGNRYGVTDRNAISRCAAAAVVQANNQYRGGYPGYGGGGPYPYNQPYGGYGNNVRVTAITDVERRSNGLRVRGLLDSGLYAYNPNYPYNQGYAGGDLTFRCTVDWRGYVSDVRVRRRF